MGFDIFIEPNGEMSVISRAVSRQWAQPWHICHHHLGMFIVLAEGAIVPCKDKNSRHRQHLLERDEL